MIFILIKMLCEKLFILEFILSLHTKDFEEYFTEEFIEISNNKDTITQAETQDSLSINN